VIHALVPSAALAGWFARRPTIYNIIGHPVPEQLPVAPTELALLRAAIHRATVLAAPSRAAAQAATTGFGRDTTVLTPGVSLDRFTPELSPRTGPPRLLFPNSLGDHRKRGDLAVAALAIVLRHRPDARLVLMGEGDPSWMLSNVDSKVRAAIDMIGPLSPDAVAAEYRKATVSLLPSEHEAFGIVLLESLASGTPVVCTPTGGMPEIVGSTLVGRVANDLRADAVATAILEAVSLAAQPATPHRCRRWAAQWSWDRMGSVHERCYRDLLTKWKHGRRASHFATTRRV
jgi:glycosyltransferase involved in cell wall biosynthesis